MFALIACDKKDYSRKMRKEISSNILAQWIYRRINADDFAVTLNKYESAELKLFHIQVSKPLIRLSFFVFRAEQTSFANTRTDMSEERKQIQAKLLKSILMRVSNVFKQFLNSLGSHTDWFKIQDRNIKG